MNVKQEYQQTLAAAQALAAKAIDRDFTEDELAVAQELQRKAFELEPRVKQWEADQKIKAAIAELGDGIGLNTKTDPANGRPADTDAPDTQTKALPEWATKGRGGRSDWVKDAVSRIDKVQKLNGTKAIVSSSIDTPSPILSDISRIGSYPMRVMDLLVNRQRIDGNEFGYIKQTTRTTNAAPVADGDLKPTSIYTSAPVEGKVHVIAHLSEALPLRLFDDHNQLGDFLQAELFEGLQRVVEAQVIAGSGVGENSTGILNTSGTLSQAWSSDLLTTLRKAATALDLVGESPNAWVMHPNDVETLDLLADNENRFYWTGPQQQITGQGPVWSLPIVKSLAVPQGTGILGDWNQVRLIVRDDAEIAFDYGGAALFDRNLFKARVEGRYGVAVLRPPAFAEVALTAP